MGMGAQGRDERAGLLNRNKDGKKPTLKISK
jgi:hypothetical protein